MELNEREIDLITSALHELEGQCIGDELHYEKVDDLGGTPNPEEVRALMVKLDRIRRTKE